MHTNEDDIRDIMEKCGKINKVKILKKDGKSKGCGFVEFDLHEDAEKAFKEKFEIDGRNVYVDWAGKNNDNKGFSSQKSCSVFVGNLTYDTNEDDIRMFFKDCGRIVDVRIAKGDNDKPKGFCHIDFENEDDADKAVKMNGEDLNGRNLKIDFARTRDRNRDRSRDRRRDRSRDGFRRRGERGFRGRGRGDRERGDRGFRGRGDRGRGNRGRGRCFDNNDRDRSRNKSRDRY